MNSATAARPGHPPKRCQRIVQCSERTRAGGCSSSRSSSRPSQRPDPPVVHGAGRSLSPPGLGDAWPRGLGFQRSTPLTRNGGVRSARAQRGCTSGLDLGLDVGQRSGERAERADVRRARREGRSPERLTRVRRLRRLLTRYPPPLSAEVSSARDRPAYSRRNAGRDDESSRLGVASVRPRRPSPDASCSAVRVHGTNSPPPRCRRGERSVRGQRKARPFRARSSPWSLPSHRPVRPAPRGLSRPRTARPPPSVG